MLYHERGDMEGSDEAKVLIEEEQRRKRKIMEAEDIVWKPNFFEKVPHPHIT